MALNVVCCETAKCPELAESGHCTNIANVTRMTQSVIPPPQIDALQKVAVGALTTEHPRTHHANKGVTAINTALALAQEAGLDLVEIAPNSVPPRAAR